MSCTSDPSDFKGTLGGQAACARIRVPNGNMGDLYVKSGLQGRHHKSEILGETVDCHMGYSKHSHQEQEHFFRSLLMS